MSNGRSSGDGPSAMASAPSSGATSTSGSDGSAASATACSAAALPRLYPITTTGILQCARTADSATRAALYTPASLGGSGAAGARGGRQ